MNSLRLYLLEVNFVRTVDSSHARQHLNYLIFECIYFAYNFLRFPVVFHAVISQFFYPTMLISPLTSAYCNLRNETKRIETLSVAKWKYA